MNEHKRRTRSRESRKKQLFLRVGITVLTLAVLIFGGMYYYVSTHPLKLKGDVVEQEMGEPFDPQAYITRVWLGSPGEVSVRSEVDTSKEGDYPVVYEWRDHREKAVVKVRDTTPPTLVLKDYSTDLAEEIKPALFVAQIAKTLGADGAVVAEEGYGNPDADFVGCIVALEDAGVKTVGISNECTGRDGQSQPLVTLDEKCDAIVSCGNVSELIELPPMEIVLGELEALGRDGLSGGWAADEKLGPSVREVGSIIMENNSMFCGDQVCGWSPKTMKEF